MRYQPYHEAHDEAKVEALMESMAASGWQGRPVVVEGTQALTGAHRLAAWRRLHEDHNGVPTVSVADVFAAADLDWTEAMEDAGYDVADAMARLPDAVRDEYGIDIH